MPEVATTGIAFFATRSMMH